MVFVWLAGNSGDQSRLGQVTCQFHIAVCLTGWLCCNITGGDQYWKYVWHFLDKFFFISVSCAGDIVTRSRPPQLLCVQIPPWILFQCLAGDVLEDGGRRSSGCDGGDDADEHEPVWKWVSVCTGKSVFQVSDVTCRKIYGSECQSSRSKEHRVSIPVLVCSDLLEEIGPQDVQSSSQIVTNNVPTPNFLQAKCPSCWLGDKEGIWPVKNWVSVCWWWRCSFAHVLAPVFAANSIVFSSNKIWNGDILVLANPDPPVKMAVKMKRRREITTKLYHIRVWPNKHRSPVTCDSMVWETYWVSNDFWLWRSDVSNDLDLEDWSV